MAEPEVPQGWTSTIGQLTPIDPSLLSGEESVELTVTTREDGGAGMVKKTYRARIYDLLSIYAARRDNPNQVTAEQVGAMTEERTQELLDGKLGADEVAVDALKLGGKLAEDYLLVAEFQQTLQNVTRDIDDITDTLIANP